MTCRRSNRLVSLFLAFLIAVGSVGCSLKNRQLADYLASLEAAERQKVEAAAQMRQEMERFEPEPDGRFDAGPAKTTLREFSTDLGQQRESFAQTEPPPEAEVLHRAFLKSYDVALEALELMPELLERHEELSRLGEELEENPDGVLAKIEEVQSTIDGLKAQLEDYIQRDTEALRRVEQEKTSLRDRFELPAEAVASPEPTPAASPVS